MESVEKVFMSAEEVAEAKKKNQRKCNSEGNLWNQWKKYL